MPTTHTLSGSFDVKMLPQPATPAASDALATPAASDALATPAASDAPATPAESGAPARPTRLAAPTEPAVPARALLDKRYHGPLDAIGQGQMLSALGAMPGSAGYVAIERVSGTLLGRRGSFVLQHSGLMDRGEKRLVIEVVPDSATDELSGLRGRMDIRVEHGRHCYDFTCTLP